MGKKLLPLLLALVLILTIVTPAASAARTEEGTVKILDTLHKIIGPLFFDLNEQLKVSEKEGRKFYEFANKESKYAFFLRFMVWIMLFAALYWVTSNWLFRGAKNISITISAIIALIGTIGMPERTLVMIGRSYGGLVGILLIVLPMIGVLYLVYVIKTKNERFNNILRLVLVYLLIVLLESLVSVAEDLDEPMNYFIGFAEFAMVVAVFALIYFVVKAIFPGEGAAAVTPPAMPETIITPSIRPQIENVSVRINDLRRLSEQLKREGNRMLGVNHAKIHAGGPGVQTADWNALLTIQNNIRTNTDAISNLFSTLFGSRDYADAPPYDQQQAASYLNQWRLVEQEIGDYMQQFVVRFGRGQL